MTRPTLVVFDLDDTLYDYETCDRAGREALFRFSGDRLGVKAAAFERAYAQARTHVKERLGPTASSHSRQLYCHEAMELVGLRSEPAVALVMEQEFWRTYLLAMELRPGVRELLQLLRYHGVVTAVVTDLTAQIQFRKLHHLDLAQHLDHVVCSEETALEKASLQPFRLLASRVAPEALGCVWFVGDNADDAPVEALVAAGVVRSGRGFVLEGPLDGPLSSWRTFADLQRELERAFGADA